MPWARFDDRYPSNRKIRMLGDGAFRLYTSAICWSAENLTDGFVPHDELLIVSDTRDPEGAAEELVRRGLWVAIAGGWMIHDYHDYNPTAEQVRAERKLKAARQERWREGKRRASTTEDVDASQDASRDAMGSVSRRNGRQRDTPSGAPSGPPSETIDADPFVGLEQPETIAAGSNDVDASVDASQDPSRDAAPRARVSRPVPDPTLEVRTSTSATATPPADPPIREDVLRICNHLADRIHANGSKRPPIGKGWLADARLMLDKDGPDGTGIPEADIHALIDWCQDSPFWRPNVLSMPKFREKYEQLRLQAKIPAQRGGNGHQSFQNARDESAFKGSF